MAIGSVKLAQYQTQYQPTTQIKIAPKKEWSVTEGAVITGAATAAGGTLLYLGLTGLLSSGFGVSFKEFLKEVPLLKIGCGYAAVGAMAYLAHRWIKAAVTKKASNTNG